MGDPVAQARLAFAPVEAFLASYSIPIKIVKAQSVGEMKESLIGRDAKVMMDKAEVIIPELLIFANASNAAVAEAVAEAHDVDSDAFTLEEDEQEASLEDIVRERFNARVVRYARGSTKPGALLDAMAARARTNMHMT